MDAARTPRVPGIELGTLLGAGATAEVWEGVVEGEGRRVAVKVVRADPEALDAAAREAAVTARVAAEHVLTVEACLALDDGRAALVLPLLRGGDLRRLVAARGHLAPGEVVTVLAPLATALGRLHRVGVVHGDVSPGNVLLDLDGRPVLGDLGLGHVAGEAPTAVWGTDGYLAPEVLLGADPDAAADVYGLGALGWLCLAGAPPGAPGLRPALAEVSRAGPVAADLVGIIETAVSPRPAERPTADELAWALFGVADPVPLRLVDGGDDVSAVTYRLRAAASAPGDPAPTPGHGSAVRRSALAAARAGRALRPRGSRPTRGVLALAAGLLGVVLVGGAGLALGHRGGPSAAPAPDPVATRTVTTPARDPDRDAAAVPPSVAPRPSDPRTDRDAPRTRAADLLRSLAAARARAWRTAEIRHLARAEVRGGPLRMRDEAGIGALAADGLRYAGLQYTLDDVVTVETGDSRAVVRARLGTGAYTVAGGASPVRRPAVDPVERSIELRWTADGWRVLDVR